MSRKTLSSLVRLSIGVLLLAGALFALPSFCLWDRDTLQQEEARFPNTIELLTGRFPRHSDAYYRWRIEDRERRRAAGEDNPQLFDDLAVAWSKLGEHAQAIELMGDKEARFPGLYETAANLGTFHVHAGEFDQGARHIARALEINPEAHFGREEYQLLLVHYVLERRGGASALTLPLESRSTCFHSSYYGFWSYLISQRPELSEEERPGEIGRAVEGVLGMLRFGDHQSPILCEVLSDLLLADTKTDAKNLAARALLQASLGVQEQAERDAYRVKAKEALQLQTPESGASHGVSPRVIEAQYEAERAEAVAWWRGLEQDELNWIAAGEDVDARFAEKYYAISARPGAGGWLSERLRIRLIAGLAAFGLGFVLWSRRRRLAALARVPASEPTN